MNLVFCKVCWSDKVVWPDCTDTSQYLDQSNITNAYVSHTRARVLADE
jgi:hypothetical protein